MRRILPVCVLILFVAGVVSAQPIKDGGGGQKDKDKNDKDVVKGEVKKVDAEKGTLTINLNGKDETFKIPNTARITIAVANEVKDAKDGLNDTWFKSAEKAAGTGRFTVELTKDKNEVTKVHLLTPTSRKDN
jgi:hypothetical protein